MVVESFKVLKVPHQLLVSVSYLDRVYLELMFLAPEVAPTEIDEEPVGPTNCPEKQIHWLLPVQTTIENVHSWEECGE